MNCFNLKTKQRIINTDPGSSNRSCFAVTVALFVITIIKHSSERLGRELRLWSCYLKESCNNFSYSVSPLLCLWWTSLFWMQWISAASFQYISVTVCWQLCKNIWSEQSSISLAPFLLFVSLYILTDVLSVSRRCVGGINMEIGCWVFTKILYQTKLSCLGYKYYVSI